MPAPDGRARTVVDALVIGAGPAGLAAAYELQRAGVVPRVLDAANEIASSWRARHEQLYLNTYRQLARLVTTSVRTSIQ